MRVAPSRQAQTWIALTGAVVVLASITLGGVSGGAFAQTARSATASPDGQLIDGQYVDVTWSGFEPNDGARVRLCPADADSVDDCLRDSDSTLAPGDSKAFRSGANGIGSVAFVIRTGEIQGIRDGHTFFCDAEHACKLMVFELNPEQVEQSFTDSAAITLGFALSTLVCPETEPRVAGSGATVARAAIVQWQAETCRPPLGLNVSYATSNSINGKEAFVNGITDADYAMSGLGLTDEEKAKLTERKVRPVHVPVALGSLALVYFIWTDLDGDGIREPLRDLRLRPGTAARIFQGRIHNWADPQISGTPESDNPDLKIPSLPIRAIGRADNSAATWWLSSWIVARDRAAWEEGGEAFQTGPTAIFPAGNAVQLRTGSDAVALQVRTFPGEQESGGIPNIGLIGFVYLSEALKLGLPVAALENGAGEFVEPNEETVLAGLRTGTISDEGIFQPNFNSTDPTAYPIPVVTYAIAPSGGEGGLDAPRATVLQKFLDYSVNEGQASQPQRGYVKLPEELTTFSNAGVAAVGPPPAAAPSPTPQANTASTPPPQTAVVSQPLPAAGGTVGESTSTVATRSTNIQAAPAATAAPSGPVAPVKRTVSGLLRLVGGAGAPVTVPNLVGLGLMALIIGRAIAVLSLRRNRRSASASGSQP